MSKFVGYVQTTTLVHNNKMWLTIIEHIWTWMKAKMARKLSTKTPHTYNCCMSVFSPANWSLLSSFLFFFRCHVRSRHWHLWPSSPPCCLILWLKLILLVFFFVCPAFQINLSCLIFPTTGYIFYSTFLLICPTFPHLRLHIYSICPIFSY